MFPYNQPVNFTRPDQLDPAEGNLNMNEHDIVNLDAPSSAEDATNKKYVDDGLALKSDTTHNHKMNELTAPDGVIDLNSQRITDLFTPQGDTDATNKAYVDGIAVGLQVKDACVAASTTDITNLDYRTTQLDGYTYTSGQRLLVKDQDDAKLNGIYVGSTTDVWTRALDANTSGLISKAYTFVENGDSQAASGWVVEGSPTLGVDDINFIKFSQSGQLIAGDGIDVTGRIVSAVGTTNRILVSNAGIDISPYYAGQSTITEIGTVTQGKWLILLV